MTLYSSHLPPTPFHHGRKYGSIHTFQAPPLQQSLNLHTNSDTAIHKFSVYFNNTNCLSYFIIDQPLAGKKRKRADGAEIANNGPNILAKTNSKGSKHSKTRAKQAVDSLCKRCTTIYIRDCLIKKEPYFPWYLGQEPGPKSAVEYRFLLSVSLASNGKNFYAPSISRTAILF